MMTKEISPLYWLWIPAVFMVVQIALEFLLPGETLSQMLSENGPHESMQALLMIAALFLSLFCLFSKKVKKTFLLKIWFGLAALCSFYVAGEEVSWGQHLWDWATPEFWSTVNDQEETNLHNTSSWFDQKPRLLLLIGIVFGTLVITPLYKRGVLKFPDHLSELLPSMKLSVIAILILVPQLIEKFFELFDIAVFARFSEVQELYMFYFVLLYIFMLKAKMS